MKIFSVLILIPLSPVLGQGEIPVITSIVTSFESYDDLLGLEYTSFRYGQPWVMYCSSELPAVNGISYFASNLLDGDLTTAWVEGAEHPGIGETFTIQAPLYSTYLEKEDLYSEEGDPGIDTMGYPLQHIIVYNGYQKSPEIWEANGRVRSLLMWNNGSRICIIELEDTMVPQEIDLLELWNVAGPDYSGLCMSDGDCLEFEILEVYPGTTYEDTAISEILIFGGQV